VALDIPPMRTTIPIVAIHRRNGYLSSAAKLLLALLTKGTLQPKALHCRLRSLRRSRS
jgi:hypothetical protein